MVFLGSGSPNGLGVALCEFLESICNQNQSLTKTIAQQQQAIPFWKQSQTTRPLATPLTATKMTSKSPSPSPAKLSPKKKQRQHNRLSPKHSQPRHPCTNLRHRRLHRLRAPRRPRQLPAQLPHLHRRPAHRHQHRNLQWTKHHYRGRKLNCCEWWREYDLSNCNGGLIDGGKDTFTEIRYVLYDLTLQFFVEMLNKLHAECGMRSSLHRVAGI